MTRRHALPLLLASPFAAAESRAGLPAAVAQSEALLQEAVSQGLLNAAVLDVRRGDIHCQRAFGSATLDARFLLGSITKPLTAIAALVLVDRGQLSLDMPAHRFLPELQGGGREKITLRHLLIHTSGLPDQLPENADLRARHAPLADFVAAACRTPLLFEPGTRYHYQSMGILLAAEIIQRISDSPLPDFLQSQVFQPLDLPRLVIGVGDADPSAFVAMQTEHAAPESGAGDPAAKSWDWNSRYWRTLAAPWGGAHGSAADLSQLLLFFLQPEAVKNAPLRPETARLMIQNHTPGLAARRGLGWMLGDALGRGCSPETFGHSGSTGTLAWADPCSGTRFVLLTSLPKNASGSRLLFPASDLISSAPV